MSSETNERDKDGTGTAGEPTFTGMTIEGDAEDGYQIVIHRRFSGDVGVLIVVSLAPDALVTYSVRAPKGSYTQGIVQVDVTDGSEREELSHVFLTGHMPAWAYDAVQDTDDTPAVKPAGSDGQSVADENHPTDGDSNG